MLRKLLNFGGRAARVAACAALLAGGHGALAQGIPSPEPTVATEEAAAQPVAAQAVSPSRDWSEWALALSVLSLIGVAFLVVTRPKHRHRSSSSSGSGSPTTRLAGATDELTPGQFKEVQKMIARALADQNRPGPGPAGPAAASAASNSANRPKLAANTPRPKTASTALPPPEAPAAPVAAEPQAAAEPAVAAEPAPAPPAPVGPRRAYVSSAPVNGRFRRNVLQGQPAHNSIYELTWDPARPDETTFQVNPDVASHPRHISSYADVLEPACEFNLPQGAASRIVTEAPGLLRRVDGDDWEIVRKARIYFA
ncbi:hypothetical protein [Hymenobacter sp. PAMC 26628]|uniref:hypothetical protein n=1 Tax=Hymenobacter sp. PAMC 26628 TaxID=1484118 RepID=UPI000770300E|nr:hypothetical protein [Hymenobacter sp. PAMC 26628]AMJ66915.1 hypothetical protein AXW84_16880 [Hymenobacter sp. PAMC 26628]